MAVIAALVVTGVGPALGAKPPAPVKAGAERERPNIVVLASVDGMPGDSADAHAFVSGLRGAFEPDFYLTEGATGGPPRVSMALANRFRLVQGDPFGDEWQVQVTIMGGLGLTSLDIRDPSSGPARAGAGDSTGSGLAKPAEDLGDTVEGLTVNVAVLSPEAVEAGARPRPVREDLLFHLPLEPRAAWYSHAGRTVGLLAVEALHHRSGDLEPDTRVRLDRAVRMFERDSSTSHR